MESEDSIDQMSPNNPFLNNFSVDFTEDEDNDTIIDSDYNEDNEPFDELNHIEKVCTQSLESSDESNDKIDDTESDTEVITNCFNDDLLMGSQLMADKYLKNKQNSNQYDVHKKCKTDQQNERQIRSELQMELELERQQRIHFQKQLEEHMSYSLRKEFDDSKQIKTLKLELLKCKQELQTLKKSLKNTLNNNYNDFDINSIDSNNKSNEEITCRDCNSAMKSEVSMILHLINHCIEEEEFRLETNRFRLDEFTDSMIDSIRKSVSYCCPRCHLNFNCLEIYYHIYKCHTKEKPLVCNKCKVYSTHLDYWREHNQLFHNGVIQSLCYIDIGKYVRKSDRLATNKSYSNGNNSTDHKSYKPYTTNRSNINSNYGLRSARNRQLRASSSYESKSVSDRSESPEVIQLCDSPSPPPPPKVQYRPTIQTKPTLAVKSISNEFECDFPDCDFKTTSKDKLEFHTSAHTNSKFKCPYCPYVGNILNDIIRHIQKSKKHDGLKVYECRECSFGTNCLSSFKEHLNSKHFSGDSDEEDIREFITDMFRNEHSTNDDINGS